MNAGFPQDMVRAFSVLVVGDEDGELRLGRDVAGFYLEGSGRRTPVDLDELAGSRTTYESRAPAVEAASDHLIRILVEKAASSLEARGAPRWPLEAALEKALVSPLSTSDGNAEPRAFRDVPGWTPDERPGAVDLIVDYRGHLRIAFELKLGAVSESLWDIVKLINMLEAGIVDTAYVVVGAHDDEWAATPIGDLFNPEQVLQPSQHDLAELIQRCKRAWTLLLKRSAGEPVQVPSTFSARLVASRPVTDYPGMSLRALAVKPVGRSAINFAGGWPVR